MNSINKMDFVRFFGVAKLYAAALSFAVLFLCAACDGFGNRSANDNAARRAAAAAVGAGADADENTDAAGANDARDRHDIIAEFLGAPEFVITTEPTGGRGRREDGGVGVGSGGDDGGGADGAGDGGDHREDEERRGRVEHGVSGDELIVPINLGDDVSHRSAAEADLTPEVYVLRNVTGRLSDRNDLELGLTLTLHYRGARLGEEVSFKRRALTAAASNAISQYEYGTVSLTRLRRDMLVVLNGVLETGKLDRVDVEVDVGI